jgi:hypothetical protein
MRLAVQFPIFSAIRNRIELIAGAEGGGATDTKERVILEHFTILKWRLSGKYGKLYAEVRDIQTDKSRFERKHIRN